MKCQNPACNNDKARHIRVRYIDGQRYECCEVCGRLPIHHIPDDVSIVHKPYFDEHLRDAEHPKGQYITDRNQKSRILKKLGYREMRESKFKYIIDPKQRQKYFRDQIGEQ